MFIAKFGVTFNAIIWLDFFMNWWKRINKCPFWLNLPLYWLHSKGLGFFSWTSAIWLFNFATKQNFKLHKLHSKGLIYSWTLATWLSILLFTANFAKHMLHSNGFFFHEQLKHVNLYFFFVCKLFVTWFTYKQIF